MLPRLLQLTAEQHRSGLKRMQLVIGRWMGVPIKMQNPVRWGHRSSAYLLVSSTSTRSGWQVCVSVSVCVWCVIVIMTPLHLYATHSVVFVCE